MNSNYKIPKHKRVYSLRVKQELKILGFEPILEADNIKKPGFKCWVYEATPAFLDALVKIAYKKEE